MAVSVADLISSIRLTSGLRNNQLFSDSQIATIATDGYADLRDKLIVRFAAWFKDTYDFTLTSSEGGNVLDLSLIPDFQMAQGLDLLNNGSPSFTVPMLDSFAERNQYNNLWPLGVGWSYNGFLGRRYWIDGDTLTVYPSQNAGGNYRLIYTPMLKPFALPVSRTFDIESGDLPQVPPPGSLDGTGAWLLTNANPDAATDIPLDGGFDLTLTLDSPNGGFSGTYNVVAFGDTPQGFGRPTFGCSNLGSTVGFTNPAGGSVTYDSQPT